MNDTYLLYSDFNCPFCFALEERLAGLPDGVRDRVAIEWRGVEHAPELPVPMADAGQPLAAALEQETVSVSGLAPGLGLSRPRGKPNTRSAILAAAEAIATDPVKGLEFKRSLYAAFWREGRDLSDPAVLSELAAGAGLEDVRPGPEAAAKVESWRDEWAGFGVFAVPMLVAPDQTPMPGLVTEEQLLAFLR